MICYPSSEVQTIPAPKPAAGTPVTDVSQLVNSVPATPDAPAAPAAPTIPQAAPVVPHIPNLPTPGAAPRYGHHNVETVNLGDDTVATGEYEVFKGRKDQIDRLSILDPRHAAFARCHYVEDSGFVVCNSSFQKQGSVEVVQHLAPCCERLGPPKKRFSVMVVHYMTDNKGRFPNNVLSFTLKVWRFGEPVFDQLRTLDSQFPIDRYDVMVNCTDEQYQRMTITPCSEYMLAHEAMKPHLSVISSWFNSMRPKLDKTTGKRLDQKEMNDILFRSGGSSFGVPPVAPGASDVPATDVNALLGVIGGLK